MASQGSGRLVRRLRCDHQGCTKSYLRAEHLNRHRLTHRQCAFQCYLCTKQFTRNDLLHVHLRRHEKDKMTRNNADNAKLRRTSEFALHSAVNIVDCGLQEQTIQSQPQSFVIPNTPDMFGDAWPLEESTNFDQHQTLSLSPTDEIWTSNNTLPDGNTCPQPESARMGQLAEFEVSWLFEDQGFFGMPGNNQFQPFARDLFDIRKDEFHHNGMTPGINAPHSENLLALSEIEMPRAVDEYDMWHEDYQRVMAEFPSLASAPLGGPTQLLHLFYRGLDYTDICMPFLHRPTLRISALPTLLITTICCLGGFVGGESGGYDTGVLLYRLTWDQCFLKAHQSARIDVSTLQTMVLVEHIGFHALSRSDHEMADVFHSMTMTLARRRSLLADINDGSRLNRLPLKKRWEHWAERESIIRLGHIMFVHDIDYSIHFMHPQLLSLGMIKLPLPCPQASWQANTAAEWEECMEQARQPLRVSGISSLQASVELFIQTQETLSSQRRRTTFQYFSTSPFTMQVLIHGLASAVSEHRFRNINSGYAAGMNILKVKDLEGGLACWYSCFQNMKSDSSTTELARSSLLTYHITAILLHESLSDIQMAAGTSFSWGRAVTPQRAQQAFEPLVTTKPVGVEAYRHALEVISLCFNDSMTDERASSSSRADHKYRMKPLSLMYNAFIGVLVLWGYALGLSRHSSARKSQRALQSIWKIEDGALKTFELDVSQSRSTGSITEDGTDSTSIGDITESEFGQKQILEGILLRGFSRSEIFPCEQDIEIIKEDVRELMRMVRDQLSETRWEIAQEARRVLESLLEKNGFME